jgi:hypothetical protein
MQKVANKNRLKFNDIRNQVEGMLMVLKHFLVYNLNFLLHKQSQL